MVRYSLSLCVAMILRPTCARPDSNEPRVLPPLPLRVSEVCLIMSRSFVFPLLALCLGP